jgi:branched-chain amino acid aminotransferase
MAEVFLNGAFVPRAGARVSALDAAVQHGVGLFETMLGGVIGGRPWVFRLGDHLQRLKASALGLGLSQSLREDPLGDAVLDSLTRSGLERARVRLTITGGDLNMLASTGKSAATPTVLIVPQPATVYPDAMFERGTSVVFADTRANPLNPFEGHKTINYWWRLRELQVAAAKGAGEAIVLQVSNHVAGGCVSNLFIVKDGELVTPIARSEEAQGGLPSPVLPGIVRGWVLDEAKSRGLKVRREMLAPGDLLAADEVFLTNSSWGVLPVVRIERHTVGSGAVGAITGNLRSAWIRAAGAAQAE